MIARRPPSRPAHCGEPGRPLNAAATVAALQRAGLGRTIQSEELERRRRDVQVVDVRDRPASDQASSPPASVCTFENPR